METVKQENLEVTAGGNGESPERTFTQEEVNGIIADRLSRERAKYSDYDDLKKKAEKLNEIEESNKSELEKATDRANELQEKLDKITKENEINSIRTDVAKESGIPVHLLTAETKEGCEAQAKAIMEYANPSGYPQVKDGGEVSGRAKKETKDQFADWFNSEIKKK